jgi:integrase
MASIQCRTASDGKKSYLVRVRLKGYPLQTATFERLTDAKRWAASTESAIREGRHFKTSEAKRHTLADAIKRYYRDVLPRKSSGTASEYRRHLDWWSDEIGAYALADVTPAVIVECRDKLAAGTYRHHRAKTEQQRGPATVNRYLAALSHALTIAEREWGWIEDNPCRKVSKLKEPRGRVRYLSDDERRRLLEACKVLDADLYDAVVLALSTGTRRMEALSIRWRDVDLKNGFVTLDETKNGERRTVALAGPALELLKQRSKVRRLDTDYVFPSPIDPKSPDEPRKPITLRQSWPKALEAAGITDFRFHDLRHSTASYLAMNGASLAEIAEVLGHKTLAMVKRYAHISPQHIRGVVERMNAAIFDDEAVAGN